MLKKILLALLVIIIIAQFIQPPHNSGSFSSAADITHTVPVPTAVMNILEKACNDCHSNNTRYPWYSRITPVNWWLNNHIKDGKKHLNFSDFNSYSFKKKAKKLDEVAETVEKHEMPLDSYTWIHKDAKLNESEIKTLTEWAKNSSAQVMKDSLQKL